MSRDPIQDPLATLPSILAIPGIRRQVEAKFQGRQPARQSVAMLLALDPLSVLRCLRLAHSPVYNIQRPVRTILDLVEVLGHNAIMRAMDQPPSHLSGVGDILKLWLHAIATAQAARNLAEQSGGMDPDEAYMCGLLHDFSLWLHYLEKRSNQKGTTHTPRAWARHWNLDDDHVLLFDGIALTHTNLEGNSYADPLALVGGAELLAELADFWHPDCDDELARDLLLSSVSKEELIAARGCASKSRPCSRRSASRPRRSTCPTRRPSAAHPPCSAKTAVARWAMWSTTCCSAPNRPPTAA